jgi:hypothetical protein
LEQFWGSFWNQKRLQKVTNNGTDFGTLSLRISEVQMKRFCELNESGEIAIATGIILAKRKGGIYIYMHVYESSLLITGFADKVLTTLWLLYVCNLAREEADLAIQAAAFRPNCWTLPGSQCLIYKSTKPDHVVMPYRTHVIMVLVAAIMVAAITTHRFALCCS